MSTLFPHEFIQAILPLRLAVGRAASGISSGAHRAAHAGAGTEFRDYRAYSPGDEMRHLDWNVYRRTGQLFMRRRERLDVVPVHILLDTSRSMQFDGGTRLVAAQRIAAAYAAAALSEPDGVVISPFGSELHSSSPTYTSQHAMTGLLSFLENVPPSDQTDITTTLARFGRRVRRSGIVVILSDFYDANGLPSILEALAALRHRVCLVRISCPEDALGDISEDQELIDCETGQSLVVSPGAQVQRNYQAAYRAFADGLKSHAAQRGWSYQHFDARGDLLAQLTAAFPEGVIGV